MSSDREQSTGSPTSSPFWSRSYAEFLTDKEPLEAKAVVEGCFRRRARRAGLEETLPVGRPMTEREIDDLSNAWETGSGAGQSAAGR
jgi:hypothetical protein